MEKRTDLFAEITNYTYESVGWSCDTVETSQAVAIKDEQEAVEKCRKLYAESFRTFHVTTLIVDGEEYRGKPKNYSPVCYLVRDGLLSKFSVVETIPQNERDYAGNQEYIRARNDALFFRDPYGRYERLKGNIKVYSMKTGELLWPLEPPRPSHRPRNKAAPDPSQ